jgi:hypothetical protein
VLETMSAKDSEKTNELHKGGDLTDVDKMRFDYAWKWFDFQAKQRMQLFNFFLIITGILASAYISAYEKRLFSMSIAVGLIGTLQAFGFLAFDVRSRELTRYAEDVLERIEQNQLFTKSFTDDGPLLGFMLQEKNAKMREGATGRGIWKTLLKMKVWIRLIEIVVGLVFLTGLVVASIQLAGNSSGLPNMGTANQSTISDPAKQSNVNNDSADPTTGAK